MIDPGAAEAAHPLATTLIEWLRASQSAGPVLEVGAGRGRNTRALAAAGIDVTTVADEAGYTQLPGPPRRFAAALATHAYLHGETAKLRIGFAELARVLANGAPAFFTLGSIRDARFGFGIPFDDVTYAPGEGDEMGIPHAYFDRAGAIELLRPFEIVTLEEHDVDGVVGRWAHGSDAPDGRVHWFVHAVKK